MARRKQETLVLFPDVVSITRKFSDSQFGELMRAAFAYRFGGEVYSGNDAAVDVAFQTIANQIDRYQEFCTRQSINAKGSECQPSAAKESQKQPSTPPYPSPSPYPNPSPKEGKAGKPPTPARQKYGPYGWVRLTEEEYTRLVADFGEVEALRCINYVDESAQSSGNKNRWRDWNLVVRKCHRDGWGLSKSTNPRGGTPLPTYEGAEQWSL